MKLRYTALVFCILASGCGGGGGGGGAVSPPPVPLTSPTPSPGPLSVTPQSIALSAPGATQTYTATESTYSGAFHSATDASCAGIASVNPSAVTTSPATFTVTAGSKAGSCSITVGDAGGQLKTVTVTVTITQGTIQ